MLLVPLWLLISSPLNVNLTVIWVRCSRSLEVSSYFFESWGEVMEWSDDVLF